MSLTQPKVRLKGGARTGEGRVEVLKGSEWGTVCDDLWSLPSASVVCRELGFGTATEALTDARMGQGRLLSTQLVGFLQSMRACDTIIKSVLCKIFIVLMFIMKCNIVLIIGTGHIYMNEVRCQGNEKSLWDCPYSNITSKKCKHMEDASVKCNVPYMGFEKRVRISSSRNIRLVWSNRQNSCLYLTL